MADRAGCCGNMDHCPLGVAQRVVLVPDGRDFTCSRCGQPLHPAEAPKRRARSLIGIATQAVVIALGLTAVAYRLNNQPNALASATPAGGPAPPAAAWPDDGRAAGTTVLLRLAGSDVAGDRLAPQLAAGYLALLGETGIGPLPGAAEGVQQIGGGGDGPRHAVAITSNTAAAGLAMLLRGAADAAMSATRLSGVEAGVAETPVAIQGIAVVVHPGNPVPSLTVAQVRALLSGRAASWPEVGGAPGPVHVYVASGRGSAAIAPQDAGLAADGVTATALQVPPERLAAAVASDPLGLALLPAAAASTVKVLPLGERGAAVAPTAAALSNETYPLTRRLYLYSAASAPATAPVSRFLAYATSPAAQAAILAAGFTPIPAPAEPAPDPDADRVRQALGGARRISGELRLQPGTAALDARSVRELERAAAQIKAQRISSGRLIVAGFTDGTEGPGGLQVRAEAVRAALARAGLPPGRVVAVTLGAQAAGMTAPDARERSRRVEVYAAPRTGATPQTGATTQTGATQTGAQ